jgi:hypothetical protein
MAHRRNAPEDLEERTFFGRLEGIISFELPALPTLGTNSMETFVLAAVRTCKIISNQARLPVNVMLYSQMGNLDLMDLTTVQCAVGHAHVDSMWAIIDRTGSLNRAWYNEDNE